MPVQVRGNEPELEEPRQLRPELALDGVSIDASGQTREEYPRQRPKPSAPVGDFGELAGERPAERQRKVKSDAELDAASPELGQSPVGGSTGHAERRFAHDAGARCRQNTRIARGRNPEIVRVEHDALERRLSQAGAPRSPPSRRT